MTDQGVLAHRRVEFLLIMLVLVVVGPMIHEYKAQQASRYVFTAAMWDDHSVRIDRYADADPPVLGIDRAVRDGHTYSDKAPLQPLLAVPFFAAYRTVGGEPADVQRLHENLGVWWITLWMASVPAAVLVAMMYRFARRFAPSTALVATLGLFAGSMLLPFSAVLFGHVMAAAFAFAAFVVASRPDPSTSTFVAAGALAGAAVAVEYTASLAVIVLTAYVMVRHRRRIGWFIAGGIPFAALVALYHSIAFGSPLAHPYRYSAFNSVAEEARPFFSIFSSLRLDRLGHIFFAGRGYAIAAPLVVVGLFGLVLLIRRARGWKRDAAWVSLATFVAFLLIPLFWGSPWGGDSPGPRYMTPALPFVVAGVAVAWSKLRLFVPVAAVVGVLTMGFATLTDPLINRGVDGGIGMWIRMAAEGDIVPTVFTIALGPAGWLVHLALVALVVRSLRRAVAATSVPVAA